MRETTLNDILGDFVPSESEETASLKDKRPVTIWIPADKKASYDSLQKRSKRRFSKKVQELLVVMIETAEARTA